MQTAMFSLLLTLIFGSVYLDAYTHEEVVDEAGRRYHVLEINPQVDRIQLVKAAGRQKVTDLVEEHQAHGGINGGFYENDGTPAGLLRIGSDALGFPRRNRAALGWSADGQTVLIDRINPQLSPEVTSRSAWEALDYVIGGTPLLVRDGQPVTDFSSEDTLDSFLYKRHARTAVGILENGNWLVVVVDQPLLSWGRGMTIPELAELMWELGCIDALNLDGGGSTTLVVAGNQANQTRYWKQRAVGDALLFFMD